MIHDLRSTRQRQTGVLIRRAWLASLLCLAAGCGPSEYETVPVSGRVTLDGKPLPDVGITFVPLAPNTRSPNVGPGSLGKTDGEGRYTLQTVKGDRGAVPAEHVVRMSMSSVDSHASSGDELATLRAAGDRRTLPRKAEDGSLHFQVPREGTDRADFDLISDKSKRKR
ncbi:MAG: hypothetical protein ACOY3P_16735 [Planctomycetota bacterium]